MNSNSYASAAQGGVFEIELTASDIRRLDIWIASRPDPRPSRLAAIYQILSLGLIHANEAEYLQAQVAQADKDIREQFDRVLGMIEHMATGEPAPPSKKPN